MFVLRKLQDAQGRRQSYYDPGFKNNKKLVRVRPRAKSLAELASQANTEISSAPTTLLPESESSPILTSNALLLDREQSHHKIGKCSNKMPIETIFGHLCCCQVVWQK